MESISGKHFDAVIIGAGMSGLAAGIRLALFDKNVLILERHNAVGGLNSFYSIAGRKYDVGLHAMTNFVPPGIKGVPLAKMFRQLRISRDEFDLSPQNQSRIAFPGLSLTFSNDAQHFNSQVIEAFPKEADGYQRLLSFINTCDDTRLETKTQSTQEFLSDYIKDPLLRNMLLLPLFYYGSARENDIDLHQFVILFKSIYLEGFARPFEGVRQITRSLTQKYKSLGGKRKMKCGVKQISVSSNKVNELKLDNGDIITADHIISSIGLPETYKLLESAHSSPETENVGKLSFVETINVFKKQPREYGWNDTIIFFNDSEKLHYKQPNELIDTRSGVICFPNNYQYEDKELNEGFLRTTTLANYELWKNLPEEVYKAEKETLFKVIQKKSLEILPHLPENIDFSSDIIATDMFTPKTITKYTGRINGAVYGSPEKIKDGSTSIDNLYICGTDQGFLGIVGAILSGISMANYHVLKN